MKAEEWRMVPGWPKYEVSNKGQVRSWAGIGSNQSVMVVRIEPLILKPNKMKNGYYRVRFWDSCRGHHEAYIHRLVLETFAGPCPSGKEGCHYDGDRTRNDLSNLRWDTRKGNIGDNVRMGKCRGNPMGNPKLTAVQVLELRRLRQSGIKSPTLSRMFGITISEVCYIVRGEHWTNLQETQNAN